MRHETAILDQKNKIQNKKHKKSLKPLFYSVLANLKKRIFKI